MKKILLLGTLLLLTFCSFSQRSIHITADTAQHIFKSNEIVCLEDTAGSFTIDQIVSPAFAKKFRPNTDFYPRNYNNRSVYWYKITLDIQSQSSTGSVFEFFDQTTDDITAYIPNHKGPLSVQSAGARLPFAQRLFMHKNFEFQIRDQSPGQHTFYFRVRSKNRVNVIIVYRTLARFIYYTLTEYISYGVFYGMILIFCLHNLLMFIAVRRWQYVYYLLYILSVGLYEMSADGIGFQYIWPSLPILNDYIYGIALYLISLFALVFTKELLQVKTRHYKLYQLINAVLVVRTIFFLYCLFFNQRLFMLKFIEFLPLSIAFYTGIKIYRDGFKAARFFVVGYTFLFVAVIIKGVYVMGLVRFLPFWEAHYSLTISFVLEMIFLSFSIGDQVRLLRKDKDLAQEEVIHQMHLNMEMKESINRQLEQQVEERTHKLAEQSEELREKALIIEKQNEDLMQINRILEHQASEITRMNILLTKDNDQLKTKIEEVNDARVLSTELSFEEFCENYPDAEACYKFLADLKWKNGYTCLRCNNTTYCKGRVAYSRRCTKCTYEESVLLNTVFHNSRIPIVKAFYLVYLVYNSKGNISARQLSEKLDIRVSTCWAYAIRIKRVMDGPKRARRKLNKEGWSSLVLSTEITEKTVIDHSRD